MRYEIFQWITSVNTSYCCNRAVALGVVVISGASLLLFHRCSFKAPPNYGWVWSLYHLISILIDYSIYSYLQHWASLPHATLSWSLPFIFILFPFWLLSATGFCFWFYVRTKRLSPNSPPPFYFTFDILVYFRYSTTWLVLGGFSILIQKILFLPLIKKLIYSRLSIHPSIHQALSLHWSCCWSF